MSKHYKVALSLAFVLLLLSLLIFFRHSLVIKLANHFILPPPMQLNCLEFSLNWQLDADIEKICLSTDSLTLLGRDLNWQRQENSLSAQYIAIKLLPAEQSSPTAIPLTLPEGLPMINIQLLEINSAHLKQAIKLKVEQKDRQQFKLLANWQASLSLTEGRLSGDIQWTLADIKALGLDLDLDFEGIEAEQMHSTIASHFSFDGDTLVTENTLHFSQDIRFKDCAMALIASGKNTISASLSNKAASLDLSQMALQLKLSSLDCAPLQDLPAELRSTEFALLLNEPLALTANNIKTAALTLNSQNGPAIELLVKQLEYAFTGQAQANFLLNIEQQNKLKLLSKGQLRLVNNELQLDSENNISVSKWAIQGTSVDTFNGDFRLNYGDKTIEVTGQAAVNHLQIDQQNITIDDMTSSYTLKYNPSVGLNLNGLASAKQLKNPTITATKISSKFAVTGTDFTLLNMELDNSIARLSQDDNIISTITNHLKLTLVQQHLLQGEGSSQLAKVTIMGVKLADLSAEHTFNLNVSGQTLSSHHNVKLSKNFTLGLSTDNYLANIKVKEQAITALAPFSKQLSAKLSLLTGKLSANIQARLDTLSAQGNISLNDVSASYEDILLNKLNYAPELVFDSATLQLRPAMLRIESINAGVPLENFVASIDGSLAELVANKISFHLFAGTASIDKFYLDGRDQRFEVKVNNLDLARLLELEKQSGIEVSGRLAGNLPMTLNKGALSIVQGRLYNQHDGKLRIHNNAAFEALKAQQPSLSKKLSLLEQLNFEKLESDVNMDQDGQLKMNIAIVGFNPLAKETVNFNYGHDENVLVLLRALRLTDSLSKRIEQNIQNH
jgi:hypothetical protein